MFQMQKYIILITCVIYCNLLLFYSKYIIVRKKSYNLNKIGDKYITNIISNNYQLESDSNIHILFPLKLQFVDDKLKQYNRSTTFHTFR